MTAMKALRGEEVEANVVVDTVVINSENFADYLQK